MSVSAVTWPLADQPSQKARVILASQGKRLWTAMCQVKSFDGMFELTCSDSTTIENLRHQGRVSFTVVDSGDQRPVQGNGIAHISAADDGRANIRLEPYRVSNGEETYEVRISGWHKVQDNETLDTSRFSFWYQAFRAVTLPLSALPVLVGSGAAFAQGQINVLLMVLALAGTVLAHFGANAVADYFDFKNGVDLSRALSSHLGALARERVEPEKILLAAFVCFLVTVLIGLILVMLVGWPLLLFGLAGVLGCFFYTGRPFSYKYRGLGELFLGVLLGPVTVMGSYYVQTTSWNWAVFLVSIGLGMLVSSVSLANNLRDLPDDRAAEIRTLPMSLGISGTKKLYYVLSVGPYVFIAAAIALEFSFWPLALVLLSLPQAIRTIRDLLKTSDDEENIRQQSLKTPYPLNSIRLHARFGLLTIAGIAIAGVIHVFV